MSLSVTQRAMLHASEAKAASASGVVIAFDYEIVCQRAANDQDLQLTLHNQISRMISDYAPQAVFITKESWPILRQEFIAGGQTFNTGELDEGEAEPEPTTEEPENEVVVTKAQELLVNWRASKKIERIGVKNNDARHGKYARHDEASTKMQKRW